MYTLEAVFNARGLPVRDETHHSRNWEDLRNLAWGMYASYPHGEYTLVSATGHRLRLEFRLRSLTPAGQDELTRPRWDHQDGSFLSTAEYQVAAKGDQLGIRRYFVNSNP